MVLKSIMYHYVRNPEETPYKGIFSIREKDFIDQVKRLASTYEIASPASILDFLNGTYEPKKDLVVLTFDDGLKEHYSFVAPVLKKYGIPGQFFIPTQCLSDDVVLPVHKNHFLLATLPINEYKRRFLSYLHHNHPNVNTEFDESQLSKVYRWDKREVASLKYLINYHLPKDIAHEGLHHLFEHELGAEETFAKNLYVNWSELREMQHSGMIIGGHSHSHGVLSSMSVESQKADIENCMRLLRKQLNYQDIWSFSYPFGKRNTFSDDTISILENCNINYAFSTIVGDSVQFDDCYSIKRIDTKDIDQ